MKPNDDDANMAISKVFALRKDGRVEEAYEAARAVYAINKGPYASSAMFWTGVDMLKMRVNEDRLDEAKKISMALERLLDNVSDKNNWMHDAWNRCQRLLERGEARANLVDNGPEHLQMGVWGEDLAVAYLREKGYVILERDWHSVHRDIDIVAQQGDCIVFVEVKTRRNKDYADPVQAVDYKKQKNLGRAISHYINYRKCDNPWRFDVITIVGEFGCEMPEINHIEDFYLCNR